MFHNNNKYIRNPTMEDKKIKGSYIATLYFT